MISFRERSPYKVGVASIAVLATVLLLSFNFDRLPFIDTGYTIKADFADASGLSPDNEVRIAGIKVGRVRRIDLAGTKVRVTMSIMKGTEIPQQSTAEIALSTILGTKFVAIDAAKPGPLLGAGSLIPLTRTAVPFEIFQASNKTVSLLTKIDAQKLNEGFRALANVADDPDRNIAKTLGGVADVTGAIASQSDSLSSILSRGEQLVSTLDGSSPDIQAAISNTDQLLSILAKRRQTVQSLLRNTALLTGSLGGLLHDSHPQIDRVLKDLHTTLTIVDANIGQLEEALRVVGPSSESLGRILWNGRWGNICVAALNQIGTGTTANGPAGCDPAVH